MKQFCIPDTSENKKYIEKMLKFFPHRDYEEMKSLIGTYQGEHSKSKEDPVWPTPEELLNWERKMYGKPTDVKILHDPTKQESSTPTQSYSWGRTSENALEVSTKGDAFGRQFSALNAKFKEGTVIEGEDVSGKTIEEVYQKVIKKSALGRPPTKNSKLYNPKLKSKQQKEDFSYELGYLPLWQEWAKLNPELIELLAQKAAGKVLTDLFANTRVSLARALSDILNARKPVTTQAQQSTAIKPSETLFSTSTSGSYADRTRENAEWADATIHFAIDYNTAGERLTKKAAGEKYVKSPIQLKESGNQSLFAELERYEQAAQLIYEELKKKGKTTNVKLNIAGNGIYTLKGIMTQEELNEYVTNVLKHLQELGVTIAEVRSGGLTGIDEAGIIAAKKLGIPNTVHATKDWKFRDENNKDIRNEQLFKERFNIATETATETVTELPQTATEEKTEPTSSAIRTELSLNIVRFQLAFSNPIERKAIISKVALMFLNMVYTLFEEQLKILENRIANETDKSAKVELIELLENLSATDILKANGVNSLFNQIKGDLQDWLNDYNTNDGRHALLEYEMDGIANIFPNLTAVQQYELAQKWITNKASAYLRIVENWDMMVIKTLPVIKDSIGVALSIQTDSITEITGEEFIEGNEDISISDLNTANELFSKEHWTFKIREVSNFSRLSAKVKRMINDIVEIDADGNVVFDDMGDMRYLNAQVVHRELLLGLAQMNKAKDFMPAMRKLAKRHPYVNQIIDELLEDNSKACAIFKNYRKDTQIYHALITKLQRDGSLKTQTVKLNEQTGVTTLLNSWRMNYEYGNVMSRYSIYDRNGLLKKKQLKENLEIINKLHEKFKTKTDWTKEQWINFSKQEEVLNTVRSLLESVGVSVNEDFFELTITSEALTEMGTNTPVLNVLNHLRFIYDKLGEPKYSTKTPIDFIREFNSMYKYFAEVTGGVLEDCIESHIIRNGKTIYAHNNPSYVTTLIKTLSNSESFREYIELEYGPVEWFKKDGRWMNYIIKDLMDPEKGEQTREKLEHVVLYDREGKEYAQWSAVDTVLVLIELYKSDPTKVVDGEGWAYYPIPVLADAQSAEFIKYKRVVENVEATIIDRLVTVVEQELDRISLVIKRNETEDVTKIAAYDKGGMEFKFFPELNKMTVGGKSFIEALNEKKTEEERESVIKEALTQIMSERYREAMKEFDRMGLFDNVPNKANAFKYFQDFNTKELIQESLKEWFYNSVFAQSQIIELLTTDLAFYPNLTTFYKRAKQFHAPSERLNTMATWKVNGEEQFVLGYEKDENGNYVLDENGDRKINEKERFITLADAKQVSLSIEDIDKGLEGITRLSNDEKAVIKGLFRNVNTTDAQAYRTLDGMRKIMIMADEWSDALEDAYNNIKNNKWHAKDIVALMNVNKPYLYTQVNQSDQVSDNGMIRKPIQNKNSEAVLAVLSILGAILSSPKLDALNFFMERHNIDLVQFESAVKVGNQGVIDINGMEDPHEVLGHLINETQKPYYIQEVDYNDYGIQVRSTQHAVDDLILVGTLARRLMGADANPDGDPNFRFTYTQGKTTQEWTVEQWFNYYNAINTSLIVDAFQGISEKFKTVEDISKFLIDEVRTNPRWGLDLIEAFTLNSEGLFNIPLLDPSLTIRILNLLNSIIRNQVTKQKQDGAILAMVSTYGLLEENEPKIVYETDPKTGKKKVAYVECYVPCPSEELYQMLIKDGSHAVDINKKDHNGNYIVPRKYLEAIGYRIPTEATYSMAPLRIKGFLPKIVGSVIILPREITTLAGSDFDYDKVQVLYHKLNISHYDVEQAKHDYLKINQILRNVNKSKDADATSTSLSQMLEALDTEDGFQEWFEENKEKYKYLNSKTSVVSFKHDDTINKDDKEAVYNYVKSRSKAERHSLNLDLMYSYLTNSDTLENFIDPGNVSPLKKAARIIAVLENLNKELVRSKVAELLEVEESEVVKNLLNLKNLSLEQLEEIFSIIDSDTNPLSPLTWVTMHQRNMAAAEMIGVVAVHRVSHASFLRTKIKSKEVFNINGHKMSALNAILAPDGTYVSKNLAGFVGAIIDNAKDPIAGDMHLTMQTADVAFTLLRLGVSPTTMALMISQPIVQSIVKEMLKNNSSMLEAIQAVETTTRNMKILLGVRIPNKVNITDEHLMGDIVEYNKRLQTNERGDASLWVSLLAFLLEFKKLEKLGLDLKALTLSTRADSASGSAGPTMADNILTEERIQQVMERTKSKYFTIEGAEGLIKSSLFEEELMYSPIAIQQAFYTYGLEKVGDLFKDILPYQSKGTYRYLSKMLGKLSRNGRISEKTLNKLYSDFISFYLSQFPEFTRTYTVERWVNGKKEQVEVSARDYYMLDFPLEFEAFLRKPEVKQYNLFRRMKVLNRNDYNPVATIIMDNVGQKITDTVRETYMDEWTSLLFTEQYSEMMLKLFNYVLYRGFGFTASGFSLYIPAIAKMMNTSYIRALRELTTKDSSEGVLADNGISYDTMDNFLTQFIRNNLNNPELVQTILSSEIDNVVDDNGYTIDEDTETFTIELSDSSKEGIRKFAKPYESIKEVEFRNAIKIRVDGQDLYFLLDSVETDARGFDSVAHYKRTTPLGKSQSYVEYSYDSIGAEMTSLIEDIENMDSTTVLDEVNPEQQSDYSAHNAMMEALIAQSMARDAAQQAAQQATGEKTITKDQSALNTLEDMLSKERDDFSGEEFCR